MKKFPQIGAIGMNVNSAGNTTINYIMDTIKNKAPASGSPVSQEALDKLEAALRKSIRPEFDTVEINGLKSKPGDERIVSMIDEECVNLLGYVHLRKDNLKSSATFTNEQVSERAEALAWLMNENDPSFIPKDGLKNSLVSEEQRVDFHKNIHEFIKKFCAVDRDLLSKLVRQVRGGEDLIPGGSRQADGRDKTVGCSDGYGPFSAAKYAPLPLVYKYNL